MADAPKRWRLDEVAPNSQRWIPRLAVALLVVVCVQYAGFCSTLGHPQGWEVWKFLLWLMLYIFLIGAKIGKGQTEQCFERLSGMTAKKYPVSYTGLGGEVIRYGIFLVSTVILFALFYFAERLPFGANAMAYIRGPWVFLLFVKLVGGGIERFVSEVVFSTQLRTREDDMAHFRRLDEELHVIGVQKAEWIQDNVSIDEMMADTSESTRRFSGPLKEAILVEKFKREPLVQLPIFLVALQSWQYSTRHSIYVLCQFYHRLGGRARSLELFIESCKSDPPTFMICMPFDRDAPNYAYRGIVQPAVEKLIQGNTVRIVHCKTDAWFETVRKEMAEADIIIFDLSYNNDNVADELRHFRDLYRETNPPKKSILIGSIEGDQGSVGEDILRYDVDSAEGGASFFVDLMGLFYNSLQEMGFRRNFLGAWSRTEGQA
jgi:hypothetical protein